MEIGKVNYKINHKKVIITTVAKILVMMTIFFTLNNWSNIKQSLNGEVPVFMVWINHSLTVSNLIVAVILSVVFYMNALKNEKERIDWNNSEVKL